MRNLSPIFDQQNFYQLDGRIYEHLPNHEPEWRVILSCDDYDYVEDPDTISELNKLFPKKLFNDDTKALMIERLVEALLDISLSDYVSDAESTRLELLTDSELQFEYNELSEDYKV